MTRRSNGEPAQWTLPDGSVGIQAGAHGDALVLLVSRPAWPFPRLVTVNAVDCEPVKPQPMDTHSLEEARW
jgi:hypothetical protein